MKELVENLRKKLVAMTETDRNKEKFPYLIDKFDYVNSQRVLLCVIVCGLIYRL